MGNIFLIFKYFLFKICALYIKFLYTDLFTFNSLVILKLGTQEINKMLNLLKEQQRNSLLCALFDNNSHSWRC